MRPVRILIAEDSELFASVLRDVIDAEPDMTVVDVVGDGEQAVKLCKAEEPDLVLMDIRMPRMDGLSATETIMADCPTPILVVTSDPHYGGVDMSFRALSAGALDLMAKPESFPWPDAERKTFLRKVRLLAQIPVVRHQRGSTLRRKRLSYHGQPVEGQTGHDLPLVGIVASTGGPRALQRVFGELPQSFPAPVVVVQHIIPGFSAHLASWLDSSSELHVQEASEGTQVEAGNVYLAPAERHLTLDGAMRVTLEKGEPVSGHLPSGDVMLESLARHAPSRTLGVVLSGMGSDGTAGLAAIHRAGGITMVQDRESSIVYGMPQSAIDLGVVQNIVDLDRFSRTLLTQVNRIRDDR